MTQPFWPNEGDAFAAPQAEPDATDIQVLYRAMSGTGWVSGCAVTESSTPAQTVDVAAGVVMHNNVLTQVSAAADVSITAADSSNPRIDAISVNTSGTVVVTAGTAATAATIVAPAWPAGNVPLAQLYVPASDNTHQDAQLVDKRFPVPPGWREVSATSITNSSSMTIDLPAGYKALQVRIVNCKTSSGGAVVANARTGDGSIDTGSNYSYARLYYGSSSVSSAGNAVTAMNLGAWIDTSENDQIIDIMPGYDDAGQWTYLFSHLTHKDGTSQYPYISQGTYQTDAAVDRIQFYPASGTFAAQGTIYLYGLI